jgi:hypothetical protein
MPVIPAAREVEIKGSQFKTSLGKKLARPYFKNKLHVAAHTCGPSYLGGRSRRIMVHGQSRQKYETLSEKITKVKGLGV